MNSESDQQPSGSRARESAPDPPAPAPAPGSEPPAPDFAVTEVTAEGAERRPGPQGDISPEQVREHLRRRALFLRELAEARELRRRVTPHRSRRARIHAALRRRTFRIN
ncbi:hypothetical protein [Actinomadura mexicana]|uniref:Uncharacterized protein n=1 Tax=Actinomadura mexicana TaxID=134959 RepID=A0A238VZI9_9ACTN|nr:hypothetical protein [Actinomadura mexicana]SNR39303.1 hypothetical protein SAMN06265355_102527 [Actinomadura mexicana]